MKTGELKRVGANYPNNYATFANDVFPPGMSNLFVLAICIQINVGNHCHNQNGQF